MSISKLRACSLSEIEWKDLHFDNSGTPASIAAATSSSCGLSAEEDTKSLAPVSPGLPPSVAKYSTTPFDVTCPADCVQAIGKIVDVVMKHTTAMSAAGGALEPISKKVLCLTVGSFLRDGCGLEVHFGFLAPLTKTTPPEWAESVILVGSKAYPICVVDFAFQSKFLCARPTPQYKRYLSTLPTTFIGTLQELEFKIYRVTTAIEHCLMESDLPAAPWRKPKLVLSMYNSVFATDASVTSACLARVSEVVTTSRGTNEALAASGSSATEVAAGLTRASIEEAYPKFRRTMARAASLESQNRSGGSEEEEYFEKVSVTPTAVEVSGLALALSSSRRPQPQGRDFNNASGPTVFLRAVPVP